MANYLNVVNEVAVQMLAVTQFPDDNRSAYLIWEEETTRSTRQLWEERASELIVQLASVGISIEERS